MTIETTHKHTGEPFLVDSKTTDTGYELCDYCLGDDHLATVGGAWAHADETRDGHGCVTCAAFVRELAEGERPWQSRAGHHGRFAVRVKVRNLPDVEGASEADCEGGYEDTESAWWEDAKMLASEAGLDPRKVYADGRMGGYAVYGHTVNDYDVIADHVPNELRRIEWWANRLIDSLEGVPDMYREAVERRRDDRLADEAQARLDALKGRACQSCGAPQ